MNVFVDDLNDLADRLSTTSSTAKHNLLGTLVQNTKLPRFRTVYGREAITVVDPENLNRIRQYEKSTGFKCAEVEQQPAPQPLE